MIVRECAADKYGVWEVAVLEIAIQHQTVVEPALKRDFIERAVENAQI
jgi:hypothetical protein